ncbi:MAG: hypothetical protein M3Z25_11275 [Actinomycetota bacterium]|nr:hypothetical protein [Actinomycetota bacterium]
MLDVAGVLALVKLLVELVTASEFSDTRNQWGGFLRVGLLVVVLIAAASGSTARPAGH